MDDITPQVADTQVQAADVSVELGNMINTHVTQIDSITKELQKFKEMLDDVFKNDSTYQSHDQAVKEAVKVRSQTKKQIQKQPQVSDLMNRTNDLKAHVKELNTALSDYLQAYAQATGSTSFETEDGQVREIVYTAKLVKRQ
jgi:Skp family chaperone for outer membrane proteins